MYSDRVDSVTRATNPSLSPNLSLHSRLAPLSLFFTLPISFVTIITNRTNLGSSPSRHLPDATAYKARSRGQIESPLRRCSFSLALTLVFFRCLVSLDFSAPYPSPPYLCTRSRVSFLLFCHFIPTLLFLFYSFSLLVLSSFPYLSNS